MVTSTATVPDIEIS